MTSPVNVDVKLGVNKFNVDEEHPHIVVKADADKQALELLVKACPAGPARHLWCGVPLRLMLV